MSEWLVCKTPAVPESPADVLAAAGLVRPWLSNVRWFDVAKQQYIYLALLPFTVEDWEAFRVLEGEDWHVEQVPGAQGPEIIVTKVSGED